MSNKIIFILVFFSVISSFSAESWVSGDYFYTTPSFNMIWFQSEENILLSLRKGAAPYNNCILKIYKNDKISSSLKTDKNGIIVLSRFDDEEIVFSINAEKIKHRLQLKTLQRYNIKSRCFIDTNGNKKILRGFFPTGEQTGDVTVELFSDKNSTKKIAGMQNGIFEADISDISGITVANVYYKDELTGKFIIHSSKEPPKDGGYPAYFIENIDLLLSKSTDSFIVTSTGKTPPANAMVEIDTIEHSLDDIITPDSSGHFPVNAIIPDNKDILKGNIEFIYDDGNSCKGAFSLPILPGKMSNLHYRIYQGKLDADKNILFFSPDENSCGAVIFYDNWIKEIKYIHINKGLNIVPIPEIISDRSSFSVAIIKGDIDTGRNSGAILKFNRINNVFTNPCYTYPDITNVLQTPMLLSTDQMLESDSLISEKDIQIQINVPSLAENRISLPINIRMINKTKVIKSINIDSLDKENRFKNLSATKLNPEDEVSFFIDVPFDNGMIDNLVVSESGELLYYFPGRVVTTFNKRLSTLSINGIIIEDRTTKTAVNIPEKGGTSQIEVLLSTDNRALLLQKDFKNLLLKDFVFEEALFDFLKEKLNGVTTYYPVFIKQFLAADGGIKRFADDTTGNIDATMLFMFVTSFDKSLQIENIISKNMSFINNTLSSITENKYRTTIYNKIFKENFIPENEDLFYNMVKIENDIFALSDTGIVQETDSIIRKIFISLFTIDKNISKNNSVIYEMENTISGKNSGTLNEGAVAGIKIELPENAVEILDKRTIDFSITKTGVVPLYYNISGFFSGNDHKKMLFSVIDIDKNIESNSNLLAGNHYSINIPLPGKYRSTDVLIKIQNDIHSLFRECVVNGKDLIATNYNFIKPDSDAKSVVINVKPARAIRSEELKFLLLPLVKE